MACVGCMKFYKEIPSPPCKHKKQILHLDPCIGQTKGDKDFYQWRMLVYNLKCRSCLCEECLVRVMCREVCEEVLKEMHNLLTDMRENDLEHFNPQKFTEYTKRKFGL